MKIHASRRIQFAAGHRIFGHESKCRHLHGHNYVVFFHATAPALDGLGRILDFGVLKERLGGWLEAEWDHGFLVYEEDIFALEALGCVPDQKVSVVPFNPTAENMARYLLTVVCPETLKGTHVTVDRVDVWETENCIGSASL